MTKHPPRPTIPPPATSPLAVLEGPRDLTTPIPTADFVAHEYNALVTLYTHTEDSLASIFNFYLTLLSTIAGGAIVLAQINSANLISAMPLLGGLLVFAVLLGIITQDAVMNKNCDLARYALSINLLKDYALDKASPLRQRILYLYDPFAHITPLVESSDWLDWLTRWLWWSLPIGMHQLFISMMNSLAVAGLAAVIVSSVAPGSVAGWRLLVGCAVITGLAFIAHSVYVHFIYQQRLTKAQFSLAGSQLEGNYLPKWVRPPSSQKR